MRRSLALARFRLFTVALVLVQVAASGCSAAHFEAFVHNGAAPLIPAAEDIIIPRCGAAVLAADESPEPYKVVGLVRASGVGGIGSLYGLLQEQACVAGADAVLVLHSEVAPFAPTPGCRPPKSLSPSGCSSAAGIEVDGEAIDWLPPASPTANPSRMTAQSRP
jgi:hypothetical protein